MKRIITIALTLLALTAAAGPGVAHAQLGNDVATEVTEVIAGSYAPEWSDYNESDPGIAFATP